MTKNYYRITAYHEDSNLSVIFDSHGRFEKLWQFSSFLLSRGFKVLEVAAADKFLDGDMEKAPEQSEIIIRIAEFAKPQNVTLAHDGITFHAICVGGKTYIPDKGKRV